MRNKNLYLFNFLFLFSYSVFAQSISEDESHEYLLGDYNGFISSISNELRFSNKVEINVSDKKSYLVNIYTANSTEIIGKLNEDETVLSLHTDEIGTRGFFIVSAKDNVVYEFKTSKDGILKVFPSDINNVMCYGFHSKIQNSSYESTEKPLNRMLNVVPILESNPRSKNVILVDMDGYDLPAGTDWNGGKAYDATPVGWDEEKLALVWAEIAEDFAPFDINVTTKEEVWKAADKKQRQRVVITKSKSFVNGADGVAHFSWGQGKEDDPCWMFMTDKYTTDMVGDVASHELGHTFSCAHQGGPDGPYYPGHDDESHDGWVPIMGNAFKKIISQWCASEFDGATADQDDLKKINQHVEYREDLHGNDMGGASDLMVDENTGEVEASKNFGVITTREDLDYFKFMASSGKLNLTIKPSDLNGTNVINRTNLDIIAKLYSEDGQLIATAKVGHQQGPIETAEAGHKKLLEGAIFDFDLPASGVYYIEVDGYGTGNPSTGYTDYGSIGPYSVSGKVPISSVGINDLEANNLLVYPSPSNGYITVESLGGEYELINGLGKVVKNGKLRSGKDKIGLFDMRNGFYLFKIKSDNALLTKRIILNKN